MAVKQFKAESKRLLHLMINSIYTHKEIFLRELISNASDAMDKLYYKSLTEQGVSVNRDDLAIHITFDKENRVLKITDNGIGMTKEELESNLGTIAKSGSLQFKDENEAKEDINIIGQFGVGFYSAFMVSDVVTVFSRAYGADEAYQWESHGADGYTITPCDKEGYGTEILLKIKENSGDEHYDEFLEQYRLQGIVKKYSDYIRYPIKMTMEKSRPKKGKKEEYETYFEEETVNSMVPIWKKNKSEISEEDYKNFYQEKHYGYDDPLRVIHSSGDGAATYNALLFVPGAAPYNYYTKEYEKGLQLYANGVLIMEKCADLLPDCFSFMKGLVDSQDLSLNISREMLQHDRQLKVIAARLQKKIKSELADLLANDREKYESFYKNFGMQLKYGVYSGFGSNKELLQDLILFHSSSEKKLVTLAEYIGRMKEEQKYIYYATGEHVERIDHLPQTEVLRDKGFEILYLTDDIDEFAIKMLREMDGKEFRSASAGDLGIEDEKEKDEAKKENKENKDLFKYMKEALGDKVKEVRLSKRLKTHPVCLTADGELSLEMEKVLNAMPSDNKVKADRVLEINAGHPIFETLTALYKDDKEKVKTYADILYTQALLIEGLPIDDPVAYSNAVCGLMTK